MSRKNAFSNFAVQGYFSSIVIANFIRDSRFSAIVPVLMIVFLIFSIILIGKYFTQNNSCFVTFSNIHDKRISNLVVLNSCTFIFLTFGFRYFLIGPHQRYHEHRDIPHLIKTWQIRISFSKLSYHSHFQSICLMQLQDKIQGVTHVLHNTNVIINTTCFKIDQAFLKLNTFKSPMLLTKMSFQAKT